MPKFRVRKHFERPDQQLFVMAGSVLEGEIQPGMAMRIRFSEWITMTAAIQRVERTKGARGNDVHLCFPSHVAKHLRIWDRTIGNETIEIITEGSRNESSFNLLDPYHTHALFAQTFRCQHCQTELVAAASRADNPFAYLLDLAEKAPALGWYVPPWAPDGSIDLETCFCPECTRKQGLHIRAGAD